MKFERPSVYLPIEMFEKYYKDGAVVINVRCCFILPYIHDFFFFQMMDSKKTSLWKNILCSFIHAENDKPPHFEFRPQHAGFYSRGDLFPSSETQPAGCHL